MADSGEKIKVAVSTPLANGDVLITFSNDTTVLFHAQFLYEMREHVDNVQIVDPFQQ